MRGTSQQRQQVLNSTHRLQQGSSVGARYKVARLRLTTLYLYFRCSGRHGVTHPYAIKVSHQKIQSKIELWTTTPQSVAAAATCTLLRMLRPIAVEKFRNVFTKLSNNIASFYAFFEN
eukprot:m.798776 g.798776  ORF g.798776 m.798776 type:complete len:118 (-) comp23352_c0_seq15:1693-2046(-)